MNPCQQARRSACFGCLFENKVKFAICNLRRNWRMLLANGNSIRQWLNRFAISGWMSEPGAMLACATAVISPSENID